MSGGVIQNTYPVVEVKNPLIVIEWGEDLRDAVKHFLKRLGCSKDLGRISVRRISKCEEFDGFFYLI